MSISKAYRLCLFLAVLAGRSQAQYENVWIFGKNAGLDFNGPAPVAITSNTGPTIQVSGRASASVCDASGQLLFYTEGYRVYDRQYNLMPDGDRLTPMGGVTIQTPTTATAQGALIVPMPGRPERYYVFSLTSYYQHTAKNNGKLFYSVVDMTLNNGMGDVVFGKKGIPLDVGLSECMTAVAGEHCNIWLLTISLDGKLKAFEITAKGVNHSPVVSNLTNVGPTLISGCMDVSPNRKMIAFTQEQLLPVNYRYGLTLLDFDPATGTASNEQPLETDGNGCGVCFSPDNSKLYFNQFTMGSSQSMLPLGLYQYDLGSGYLPAILASKRQIVYTGAWAYQLKRAPDGKIYFPGLGTSGGNTRLSVINTPNLLGNLCQPATGVISLVPGTSCGLGGAGLPNVIPPFIPVDTIISGEEIRICTGAAVTIAAAGTPGPDSDYVWQDGHTGISRTVSASGTYRVGHYASPPCSYYVDTFRIIIATSGRDSFARTICAGESFYFNGRRLNSPGVYHDTLTDIRGCDSFITLNLSVLPLPEVSISAVPPPDLCIGDTVLWEAAGTAAGYQWLSNDLLVPDGNKEQINLPVLSASDKVAVVGLSGNGCRNDTAAAVIHADVCCSLLVPGAFSPNGDGINDGFAPVSQKNVQDYHMQIFNRWGQLVFSASDISKRWDGTWNGAAAEIGTYFYYITAACTENNKALVRKGDVTLVR